MLIDQTPLLSAALTFMSRGAPLGWETLMRDRGPVFGHLLFFFFSALCF